MASAADSLTQDIWQKILSYLSVAERCGAAALACTKLHAAAISATDTISVPHWGRNFERRQKAFKRYLQLHGNLVTNLLVAPSSQLVELPCRRLRSLELKNAHHNHALQLHAHNGIPGLLDVCKGLTRLRIDSCKLLKTGDTQALSSIIALEHLADLQLVSVWQRSPTAWNHMQRVTLPDAVLLCLSQLTCLHLLNVDLEQWHIGGLSKLSVLHLDSVNCVKCKHHTIRFAADTAGSLVLPPKLHTLHLGHHIYLGASGLSSALNLTQLHLHRATVVGQVDMSSGDALLSTLAGLPKLEFLALRNVDGVVWPPLSTVSYTSLVPTRLRLFVFHSTSSVRAPSVPSETWVQVFRRPGPLALQSFCDSSLTFKA